MVNQTLDQASDINARTVTTYVIGGLLGLGGIFMIGKGIRELAGRPGKRLNKTAASEARLAVGVGLALCSAGAAFVWLGRNTIG